MTALSEALLAAQRGALAAAQKAFVRGTINETTLLETMDEIGCRDKADQGQFLACLHALQQYGSEAPAAGTGRPAILDEPASEAQWKLLRKLADERGQVAPEGPLTKAEASEAITKLKASKEVPF